MTLAIVEPAAGRELEYHQPAAGPAASGALMRLTDWANEARAAASIAASLVKTSFVPEVFRGKPEEATAAILTGFEMGLSPMASLRAIYVIKGTPAMYAKTMRAVVQAQGHEIWVHEATASRVIVKGRRKGSDKVETSVWTTDRAKTAQLLSNQQYTKNPQNMLTARATAEVCWLVASDALHGIACSVEELDGPEDTSAPTGEVTAAEAKPARRTAQRRPLEPMPSAEPDPEPAGTPAAPEAPVNSNGGGRAMSSGQQGKLFALFAEKGIDKPDVQRQYVSEVIGRTIASRSDLTRDEAAAVIDALEQLPSPAADEPDLPWDDVQTAPVPQS